MNLSLLEGLFAICQFNPNDEEPSWVDKDKFYTITRTPKELSIVCHQESIKGPPQVEKDWRVIEVEGPLDFNLTGIVSSITRPLGESNISVFVISTFNTDYILVKESLLDHAVGVLSKAGFHFLKENGP